MHGAQKRGLSRLLWQVAPNDEGGGDDVAETAAEKPEPAEAPLGKPGLQALQQERAAREAAEKAVRDAEAALEAEKAVSQQALVDAETARLEALRVQVAATKKVPLSLASRLVGSTQEELEADADAMLAAFQEVKPAFVPARDPSQGKDRGGDTGGTLASGRDLYQRLRGKKN